MREGDRLARAKSDAASLVDSIRGRDLAQVAVLGSHVETLTDPTSDRGALKAAIASISASDQASSYAEFARFVRGLPSALGLPVQAHLFSDLQRSSLPPAFADLALADRTSLEFHPAGAATAPNWAVERVTVARSVHGSAKVPVKAVVVGFGTEAARRTATLSVNGRVVESKAVEVPPNGRAQVEFAGFEPSYGFNRGEVRIEPSDSLPADDRAIFATERGETRKVLLIRDVRQNPSYFRAALASAAGDAYDVDIVTTEESANLDPAKYALVVLADTGTLPQTLESRLKEFAEHGGGVLIECGPAVVARGRVPVLGAGVSNSGYASREGERFQSAVRLDASHPVIRDAALFDGIKFFQVARIDAGNFKVLARVNDGSPLVMEAAVGQGRAIAVASTLDNVASDFPVRSAFVPFVERMVAYLSGSAAGQPAVTVDSTVALRGGAETGAAVDVLDPEGRRALDLKQAASAKSFTFPREGYWDVRTAAGRDELYAVNADRRESDLSRIPDEALALWRGTAATEGSPLGGAGTAAPHRSPLWKYFLVALLALAIAESLVADRFQAAAEPKQQEALVKREAA